VKITGLTTHLYVHRPQRPLRNARTDGKGTEELQREMLAAG